MDQDGLFRSISTTPPSHYIVKIQSFSILAENNINIYNSGEFEVGGCKWKLILHPSGNKKKNIDDHISLYLMMVVDESSICLGSEVLATLRFFLFDQNNDDYLVIQDSAIKRFHGLIKHEWGIDRLVSLEDFQNPENGYLVDDTCVFGVEIFVCKRQGAIKGECLSMVNSPICYKHTWKIENFSELGNERQESTTFIVGEQIWKILMFPKGGGTHVSLYLTLADPASLPTGYQIHVDYTLRIVDQDSGKDDYGKDNQYWFSASSPCRGWPTFISISDINSPIVGYLKNDVCIIEAEVTVHGMAKVLTDDQ